jgi:hypothetical protein
MKRVIYVVKGSSGEYSDKKEWVLKAFTSEEKAKELVVKATDRFNEIWVDFGKDVWGLPDWIRNEYDPRMSIDYTGVHYSYYQVDLEE